MNRQLVALIRVFWPQHRSLFADTLTLALQPSDRLENGLRARSSRRLGLPARSAPWGTIDSVLIWPKETGWRLVMVLARVVDKKPGTAPALH